MNFWTRLLLRPVFFDEFNDLGGGSDADPFARLGDSFPGGDGQQGDEPPARENEPPARTPAAAEGEGDPGREQDPANAGRTRLSDEEIERLQAQNREFTTELAELRGTSAEVKRLKDMIAIIAGVKPADGGEDPRTKAVRDRMFTHFPELKVLAEYGSDLPSILKELKELLPNLPKLRESFPTISRNLEDGQVRNAESFASSLESKYAVALLGDGKTGKDLTDAQVARLGRNFIAFCSEDPKRVSRYQRGDVRLVDDFLKEETETIQISRRQRAAGQMGRANVSVPSGGGSGTPLGGADKAPSKDPDAIFEESWDKTQAVIGSR